MNDQRTLGHEIRAVLDEHAPTRPPNHLLQSFEFSARRKRRYPRWLALIKEPTMRTNSHIAVGSPTVRVATVVIATLLLAVALAAASVAGQRLLAADGTIVVAQDGSGDYLTITEAVAAAADDNEIRVRPGTYTEAVVIDKDIDIEGDGPIEDIVVMAPEEGPEWDTQFSFMGEQPYAIVLAGSDATVSGLTLRGTASSLFADGGAPSITGMLFDDAGVLGFSTGTAVPAALIVTGGSAASVTDSEFRDAGGVQVFEYAVANIDGNRFIDGPAIYGDYGDGTIIRDNVMTGPGPSGIRFGSAADVLVEGNQITGRQSGIDGPYGGLGAATVQDNSVSGATSVAISVSRGTGRIGDNTLLDNRTAIVWSGTDGLIEGNVVNGGDVGIVVGSGASVLRDNTVEGVEGRGIKIAASASPVLSGNTSCGNGTNLVVLEGAALEDDGTNEICEDVTAE